MPRLLYYEATLRTYTAYKNKKLNSMNAERGWGWDSMGLSIKYQVEKEANDITNNLAFSNENRLA